MRCAIAYYTATGLTGDLDKLALQILGMGLGQVLVLAGNKAHTLPEVLATLLLRPVMLLQPLGHIIRLADIHPGP